MCYDINDDDDNDSGGDDNSIMPSMMSGVCLRLGK